MKCARVFCSQECVGTSGEGSDAPLFTGSADFVDKVVRSHLWVLNIASKVVDKKQHECNTPAHVRNF